MRQGRGELAERGEPRNAADLLARLNEGVLGLLPVGDVETTADVPRELPCGIVLRRTEVEHPAVFAIEAPQTVFQPERLPRVEGRAIRGEACM